MAWAPIEQFGAVIKRTALNSTACPALRRRGLLEIGLTHAGPGWCFVRPEPAFGLVLVTIDGAGEVLVDERWRPIATETAYLMPPAQLHGYRVTAGHQWRYAWVRLPAEHTNQRWISAEPARMMPVASYALHAAISGLLSEQQHGGDARLLALWAELVQASLQHLQQPAALDPRLVRLWQDVSERLDEAWDLPRLARHAHLSREHLRRLCQRGYGRSPHQHLADLRLHRAGELLLHGDLPLAHIASQVGFSGGFELSQAFMRQPAGAGVHVGVLCRLLLHPHGAGLHDDGPSLGRRCRADRQVRTGGAVAAVQRAHHRARRARPDGAQAAAHPQPAPAAR